MKTVFEGLFTKFTGSALSAAVGGRYFPIQAEVGTALPYVVASVEPVKWEYQLSHKFVDVLVEISVFADNENTMFTLAGLAASLYDESNLSLTGYQQVGLMSRESEEPVIADKIYRYIIEYQLFLKKL